MAGPVAVIRTLEVARRSGALKWALLALTALVLLPVLAVAGLVGAAWDAVGGLTYRPTQATAMAAYMAASKCGFAPDARLGTAYLVAAAHEATSDGGAGFGWYRSPLQPPNDDQVPADVLQHVDRASLLRGGFTNTLLGLPGDYRPRDWTTVLPDAAGEWGIGFLLIPPSDWRQWVTEVPGAAPGSLDPYRPYDALVVLACHLSHAEGSLAGTAEGALQALREFGAGAVLQFADQVAGVVRRDAGRPWLIPADLARAMAAFAADRGGAYLQRILGQFQAVQTADLGGGSGRFTWPLRGPITQAFGCTDFAAEPYDPNCASRHFHTGVDIAAAFGTPVTAADDGVVSLVNFGWGGGYGNYVLVTHGHGYATLYAHLSAVLVSVGQPVARGQAVGDEGSTGFSTGPHLHFEIRVDNAVQNPLAYLP